MSNHFIGYSRGGDENLLTNGTSSTATLDVELRIADADQNGHPLTIFDVVVALKAIERQIESAALAPNGFPAL